jgi:hypothetical protein
VARRLKKKEHENLSSSNIEKVITLLSGDSPITKKEACSLLNIAYNTTRLQKIVDEYHEQKDYVSLRKSQNKGKAATKAEIAEAVTEYLRGQSVAEIAKGLYRSSGFVKGILDRVGVPQRQVGEDERKDPDYLPEECCSEIFEEGEIVWSAKHHTTAIVRKEISVSYQAEQAGFIDVNYEKKWSSRCYSIWVVEDIDEDKDLWARVATGGYNAYSLAYDLGKLSHLQEYGVDLTRI